MLKKYVIGVLSIALSVSAISCKKASMANNESEHQAINRIEMLFKQSGTTVSTIVAEDPDGDGGNPPSRIDNISLDINKTYDVEVKFFNISNGVTKDISPTILQQAKQHEVYFILSGLSLSIEKKDKDDNGFPIGLISQWKTGNTGGQGSVLLKLMHKPLIKGPNDDPSKGHSDIAISFNLNVK
ncbi:MAG: hypothetical protein Q8S11_08920 [Daejeonella sp.]|uniref:hypothetical protein n=1 Tax=Daejeonella sp. TaxID=2805397 RepID=UPI0027322ED1|nr:hypothetical protein [Daejeonella sp.]MDP3468443.1 hypothetical protein [Daejeonella sp.]